MVLFRSSNCTINSNIFGPNINRETTLLSIWGWCYSRTHYVKTHSLCLSHTHFSSPYWQLPLSSSKKRLCLSNQVLVPVPSESFHELWLDLLTGERPLGKPVMLSERRPSSSWASIWKVNGLSPRDHRLDGRKNEPIRGPDQPITPIGRWPRPRPMGLRPGDLRPEAGIGVVSDDWKPQNHVEANCGF